MAACGTSCARDHASDGGPSDATTQDGGSDADRLEREAEFWRMVAVCGTPVEEFPTISEMAEAADAAVVGRIVSASKGKTVQGDAAEDFYAEVNLRIEVDEVLRHSAPSSFDLSLILTTVGTSTALASAIDTLQARLPQERIVLLVRSRSDLGTDDLYRLVNDQGLWATTTRGALDNPVTDKCHWIEAASNPFLEGVLSLDELIEHLGD